MDDNIFIRWVCRKGHTEIVKMLLADPRVDPTANDNYAICVASGNGHVEIIIMLFVGQVTMVIQRW